MSTKLQRFFDNLKGKQIYFIGIGVTHTPTIKMFANLDLNVTLCDKRDRIAIGEELCSELEAKGVKLNLGESYLNNLYKADIVFRTPGLYYNLPELQEYRTNGGILTSEMEVFCSLCPCDLFAITGSDGKTTTTTLIAEMLKKSGKTVHLGGNIGKALLPIIFNIKSDDIAVVELSSFQLISMNFAPKVSIVTNVTPNHLDVHGDMVEYTQTKRAVFDSQDAFSSTVLSADNYASASFAKDIRGQCLSFSIENPVKNGAYLGKDKCIYTISYNNSPEYLMPSKDILLPGLHNVSNYLAAICAVRNYVSNQIIIDVAREFAGVEHRIEFIREYNGARWYNDSIASSPTRAIAGLRAFDKKIIMIAGGYDKKIPFEPLAPEIIEHVSTLILCGATADKIKMAVESQSSFTPTTPTIVYAKNLEEAVTIANSIAVSGDIISLSPACASFDQFPNFEVRGKYFKNLVNSLN